MVKIHLQSSFVCTSLRHELPKINHAKDFSKYKSVSLTIFFILFVFFLFLYICACFTSETSDLIEN